MLVFAHLLTHKTIQSAHLAKTLLEMPLQIHMFTNMKFTTVAITTVCFGLATTALHAQKQRKKLVRVKQNADGTVTELEEKDNFTIERRTLGSSRGNKERKLWSKSTYIMDKNRVLRECRIADGSGKLLFTIRYGYHEDTGRLIAEAMFDERTPTYNTKGQLIPVQRLYYK